MFYGYKLEDVDNPFYSHLLRFNNSNHIKKHFSGDYCRELKNYSSLDVLEKNLPPNFNNWDQLSKSQWLETTVFMSGYLLSSQGDRMAMANSVEGRYPFLDYRVIEFCSSLPADFKLNGLNEKYLLKKLLRNKIPEKILKRPKQAYRAPIKSVFLDSKAPDYVGEMLSESFTRKAGIFDFESISSVLTRMKNSGIISEIDNMILTSVISTHLIQHQFIDNKHDEFMTGELLNHKIISE
jgi:asparagine synthase (glutamine-hydrolysing)